VRPRRRQGAKRTFIGRHAARRPAGDRDGHHRVWLAPGRHPGRPWLRHLQPLGVSVQVKIVIARYGEGGRGLKPKLAQEHGAVGCIIFSDLRDDGYATDDAYPKGPARPANGVQRGSTSEPIQELATGTGGTRRVRALRSSQSRPIVPTASPATGRAGCWTASTTRAASPARRRTVASQLLPTASKAGASTG
jgi:hypothetical protein